MPGRSRLILVVDDLEDWQRTVSMTIRHILGYQVEVFSDEETTFQFINNNKFDLAIIDQRLDDTREDDESGLELAKQIKELYSQIPIFIITGYETLKSIDEALKTDEKGQRLAAKYILKDDNFTDNLVEAVKETLD